MTDLQKLIDLIVGRLEKEPAVEGVFVSGSLVDENRDEYSDVDLGVASAEGQAAFDVVYSLRSELMAAVGKSVHHIERGWEHCRMVAALYGKSDFPPLGLEVDLVFSRLEHVGEQMPYAPYEVVFDRMGRLALSLWKLPKHEPTSEVRAELETQLQKIPFVVHDALKALARGDTLHVQELLEGLRQSIFQAAAARAGVPAYGAKRVYRYLSKTEIGVVADSHRDPGERSLHELAEVLLGLMRQVERDFQFESTIRHVQSALLEIV